MNNVILPKYRLIKEISKDTGAIEYFIQKRKKRFFRNEYYYVDAYYYQEDIAFKYRFSSYNIAVRELTNLLTESSEKIREVVNL